MPTHTVQKQPTAAEIRARLDARTQATGDRLASIKHEPTTVEDVTVAGRPRPDHLRPPPLEAARLPPPPRGTEAAHRRRNPRPSRRTHPGHRRPAGLDQARTDDSAGRDGGGATPPRPRPPPPAGGRRADPRRRPRGRPARGLPRAKPSP